MMRRLDPGWLVAALIPIVAILPIFNGDTLPQTADGALHIHRIHAMQVLLESGEWYPRWVPWFHLGYGYPLFNFYAPASAYTGGTLGLIGVSAPVAFNLLAAVSAVAGSMGMYGLGRRFMPSPGALLAAALWAYAPSRMNDLWDDGLLRANACYGRGALGILVAQSPVGAGQFA